MRNDRFLKIVIISFIFLCVLLIANGTSQGKVKQLRLPTLTFPVLSDVHIGGKQAAKKFIMALRDCNKLENKYDAIGFVGDITDTGDIKQYEYFTKILNSNFSSTAAHIIAIGNHEYKNENNPIQSFVKETLEPGLYYDSWVKGYHFIVLGSESMGAAKLSTKQLIWLEEKLKEKVDENISKPIFVFLHQPIPHTVYGSDTWGNIINYKQLDEILKKFPQVILFSGHSHYSIYSSKTIFKDGFTMFNTAAVYYVLGEDDKHMDYRSSQGLIVEVYEEKVVVRPREFSRKKWIGEGYTIMLKEKGHSSLKN
jgi:3',5'-cyclic AMP phosphodiesterase CpdA